MKVSGWSGNSVEELGGDDPSVCYIDADLLTFKFAVALNVFINTYMHIHVQLYIYMYRYMHVSAICIHCM